MSSTVSTGHPQNFMNLKCPSSTLICREKTVILGDVTIGAECVIHPTATIIARHGPIVIGNNNLIEERVNIINDKPKPMCIGDNNVFEVDARCCSTHVGNNNTMESKSSIDESIVLTNECVIGAGCCLSTTLGTDESDDPVKVEVLEERTVISGRNLDRRVVPNMPPSPHESQLDFLRKILPNYQKLWRSSNLPSTPQLK